MIKKKPMPLKANEFIRRFLLHALPKKFMRIRHCGFLANRCKKGNLLKCRKILGQDTIPDNLVSALQGIKQIGKGPHFRFDWPGYFHMSVLQKRKAE